MEKGAAANNDLFTNASYCCTELSAVVEAAYSQTQAVSATNQNCEHLQILLLHMSFGICGDAQ